MKKILIIGKGEKVNQIIEEIQNIDADTKVSVVENLDNIENLKEYDIILDKRFEPKQLTDETLFFNKYRKNLDSQIYIKEKYKPKGHQRPYKFHR